MVLDKRFNGGFEIVSACKAGLLERFARQNAEPDFDLIQPTGRCGGVMKIDGATTSSQPFLIALMGTVILSFPRSGVGMPPVTLQRRVTQRWSVT